jgi:hypothetical protein
MPAPQDRPGVPDDFHGPAAVPPSPTQALPGSRAKVLVLRLRALRGQDLHHREDRTFDGYCPSPSACPAVAEDEP